MHLSRLNGAIVAAILLLFLIPGSGVHERLLQLKARFGSESSTFDEKTWREMVAVGYPLADDPPTIEVLEFLDYRCVACRDMDRVLDFGGDQSIRSRTAVIHLPLPVYAHSEDAARAAICAGRWDAFPPVHHFLISDSSWFKTETIDWVRIGQDLGLPQPDALPECMADDRTTARLASGRALAARLRIRMTPSFVGRMGLIGQSLDPSLLDSLMTGWGSTP